MMLPQVPVSDYSYDLPPERIALFPMTPRDASKLLVYRSGAIDEKFCYQLDECLPAGSLLLFNNSRVIPARIHLPLPSGHMLEVFCLEPIDATPAQAMQHQRQSRWNCLIGGLKKWKPRETLSCQLPDGTLIYISYLQSRGMTHDICFEWQTAKTFASLLEQMGKIPLPPYLHRPALAADQQSYQTIYASRDGSVAAPTAGLHFTEDLFHKLADRQITTAVLTLHVGAGTFKPVQGEWLHEYEMHAEWVEVDLALLDTLMIHTAITCVGTTSLRSLESLYWLAVWLLENPDLELRHDIVLPQFFPYQVHPELPEPQEAFTLLKTYMQERKMEMLLFKTALMIMPGYTMRVASRLFTNFHQPKSTLLCLVDAFTKGHWQEIYRYALAHDYRFLSYGDACLLE